MNKITHERMTIVRLSVEQMIEQIKEKLKVLNFDAIKPDHFDEQLYDELKDIYDMVMKSHRLARAKCKRSLKSSETYAKIIKSPVQR
ncbi:hypothetical protein JS44_02590 [Anoxybacillus flavithermus]|uniref:Uncharacterized protein n=1 Tax=Anoxybacillus flavithermus TaxID=33934 RepID=A0A094LCA4_9BACL|nr:hypothetical protein JS44_02590 [Anoxybacillus flavithermus]